MARVARGAPAASDAVRVFLFMPLTGAAPAADDDSWKQQPAAKVLLAQQSVVNVRFSIHKDFWAELRDVHTCPTSAGNDEEAPDPRLWPRIMGTIKSWQLTAVVVRVCKVE